jgi:uncharacterized membrane protein YphA (DoxX/SURF4 family)/thiol-disulfide isomerase/thioredoxin
MDFFLLCDRMVLAVVFAVAGVAKVFDLPGSRKALSDFGLPDRLARAAAGLLPVAELLTAILLLPNFAAVWGAVIAAGLCVTFAAVITANLLNGRAPECHCFGQLHSRPISWGLLIRDAVLAIGAGTILWWGPGVPIVALAGMLKHIAVTQPLPLGAALLALLGFAAQLMVLAAMLQQNGRLLLRVDKLEAAAAGAGTFAPPPPAAAGLPAGSAAPSFHLLSENGRVSLEFLLLDGRPVVLIFSDPDCGPCRELLPEIARWENQFAEAANFVIVSRRPAAAVERLIGDTAFRNIAWQEDREISQSYRSNGTPAAIVVRPDGRVGSWLATGRPAIEKLVMFLLHTRMLVMDHELVS